jgi:hypothetical protein
MGVNIEELPEKVEEVEEKVEDADRETRAGKHGAGNRGQETRQRRIR